MRGLRSTLMVITQIETLLLPMSQESCRATRSCWARRRWLASSPPPPRRHSSSSSSSRDAPSFRSAPATKASRPHACAACFHSLCAALQQHRPLSARASACGAHSSPSSFAFRRRAVPRSVPPRTACRTRSTTLVARVAALACGSAVPQQQTRPLARDPRRRTCPRKQSRSTTLAPRCARTLQPWDCAAASGSAAAPECGAPHPSCSLRLA